MIPTEKSNTDKKIRNMRRKNPQEMNLLLGEDPAFDQWFYQNNPYALPLQRLKEMCDEYFWEILNRKRTWGDWKDKIVVRIIDNDKFKILHFGSFFFIEDCMYMITSDDKYEDWANPDILGIKIQDLMGSILPEFYVVRVIFAGLYTGFDDDFGNRIFTGDIVVSNVLANPETPATVKSGRASNAGMTGKLYGSHVKGGISSIGYDGLYENVILLDNHYAPLCWITWIKRIGTIYFDLEPGTTEIDIQDGCMRFINQGSYDKKEFRKLMLKAIKTPSYIENH